MEEKFRSSDAALKADYPSYTDAGKPAPSADAAARFKNDGKDHFERFQEVMALLDQGKIVTWTDWFKAGNTWKKEDLQAPDYNPNDQSQSADHGGDRGGAERARGARGARWPITS